jgi:ribosomal protein S18 acetylase RimI-like enzyme
MKLVKANIENTIELVGMYNHLLNNDQSETFLPTDELVSKIHSFITGTSFDCYLINNNNICIGYCVIDKSKQPIYLRHIFINKEFRGNGFGKETINLLLEMYKTTQLDIKVMAWKENAIGFYKKMGFEYVYHGIRITKDGKN